MATLKSHGWTITVNQISGRLEIYRADAPGAIEIPIVDHAYAVRIVSEDDDLVESMLVRPAHLEKK